MLLVDLSDKGNAGASTVPNDLVTVQIAPIAFIFETIATNERMNTLMNHELVHIATMDQSAGRDRGLPASVSAGRCCRSPRSPSRSSIST